LQRLGKVFSESYISTSDTLQGRAAKLHGTPKFSNRRPEGALNAWGSREAAELQREAGSIRSRTFVSSQLEPRQGGQIMWISNIE
jgi:hypothetical protein